MCTVTFAAMSSELRLMAGLFCAQLFSKHFMWIIPCNPHKWTYEVSTIIIPVCRCGSWVTGKLSKWLWGAELGFNPRQPGCRACSRRCQGLPHILPAITFLHKLVWWFKPPTLHLHNQKVSTSLNFTPRAPHSPPSSLAHAACQWLDLALSARACLASVGANQKSRELMTPGSIPLPGTDGSWKGEYPSFPASKTG